MGLVDVVLQLVEQHARGGRAFVEQRTLLAAEPVTEFGPVAGELAGRGVELAQGAMFGGEHG